MQSLHLQYQGDRHRESNQPCLALTSCYTGSDCTIAILCEGVDPVKQPNCLTGAQIATEVAVKRIRTFVKNTEKRLLKGHAPLQFNITAIDETSEHIRSLFTKLLTDIVGTWRERVEEQTATDSQQGDTTENDPATYGCMFAAYVQTKHYWFACQLGTGKCILFTEDGSWQEVMPSHEEVVTLDDPCALEALNICLNTTDNNPLAAALTNEGFNKAYSTNQDLANYHLEMLKMLLKNGRDTAFQQLKDDLPIISQRGKQDDTAITLAYDINPLKYVIGTYITNQVETEKHKAERLLQEISTLTTSSIKPKDRHDLTAASESLEVVSERIKYLIKEYEQMTRRTYQNRPDYSEALEQAEQFLKSNNI